MSEEADNPGGQGAPSTSEQPKSSEIVDKCVETYQEVTTAVPKRKPVINSYI